MNRDDDYDKPDKGGGRNGRPTRTAKGRWLKGYCPNPKDRPSKAPARHASANGENRPETVVRVVCFERPVSDRKADVRVVRRGRGKVSDNPSHSWSPWGGKMVFFCALRGVCQLAPNNQR